MLFYRKKTTKTLKSWRICNNQGVYGPESCSDFKGNRAKRTLGRSWKTFSTPFWCVCHAWVTRSKLGTPFWSVVTLVPWATKTDLSPSEVIPFIWGFRKIGLPMATPFHHPFIDSDFPIKKPSLLNKIPHLWKPRHVSNCNGHIYPHDILMIFPFFRGMTLDFPIMILHWQGRISAAQRLRSSPQATWDPSVAAYWGKWTQHFFMGKDLSLSWFYKSHIRWYIYI